MEIPRQLTDYLSRNKVQYEILHHPEAVTAQRIAQAEHVNALGFLDHVAAEAGLAVLKKYGFSAPPVNTTFFSHAPAAIPKRALPGCGGNWVQSILNGPVETILPCQQSSVAAYMDLRVASLSASTCAPTT